MTSIRDRLNAKGLLARIAFPTQIDVLLGALAVADTPPPGAVEEGTASFGLTSHPLFFDLSLSPPSPEIPFRLEIDGEPAAGFRLWLRLASAAPAAKLFSFVQGLGGAVLKPAIGRTQGEEEWLEATAGEAMLTGTDLALLVEGQAGDRARMRLTPNVGEPDGVVTLQLEPSTVLIGDTGFGIELPDGLTLDDSDTAVAPGSVVLLGETLTTPADSPIWRGIAVRRAKFYLPKDLPIFGSRAVDAYVEIGLTPPLGIELALSTRIQATDSHPDIDVRIECHDPSAAGLTAFLPTLVEVAMELPLDGRQESVGAETFTLLAGKPVTARARLSRDVTASNPTTRMSIALESQGEAGIVSVDATSGGAAKAIAAAAALATALVAEGKVDKTPMPNGAGSGVALPLLLGAGAALGEFLKDSGAVVVHSVEVTSEGRGLPLGGPVRFKVDYTVVVPVVPIDIGILKVTMNEPMRVRLRDVVLAIHPSQTPIGMVQLDFDRANMEIEDPGTWTVTGPDSLFDILGTRSGRGSMWIEVDLRFKLNLGPIKVSGATIRGILNESNGAIEASLRGLDVSLVMPGVIEGEGAFQLDTPQGFTAELAVKVVPLNLAVGGLIAVEGKKIVLGLSVDLPGPIPIANTGLGLFGIGGAFGISARPSLPPPGDDPVLYQLSWDHKASGAFALDPDNFTYGFEAVIGTAPDIGFSFSAKGGIFLTVPDIVIRGALDGHMMSPRPMLSDRPEQAPPGLSYRGVIVVDGKDGVTFGLRGLLNLRPIVEVEVPVGARFPFDHPSEWYIYIGTDGYNDGKGRALGPVRATILPDLPLAHADAYVMLRGAGIEKWPRGGGISIIDGFVIAFGFTFEIPLGFKPVAWGEIHASADVLLATRPLLIAGFGTAGGSLHLGPFSIGVDAKLDFIIAAASDPYILARLCGHIDLCFFDVEGCVQIAIGSPKAQKVPVPDVHPLDRLEGKDVVGELAQLIDDRYRKIANLPRDAAAAPKVWPDALIHLAFGATPKLGPALSSGQFPGAEGFPEGIRPDALGSDMLQYQWTLTTLTLLDVTDDPDGPGTPVSGPLSAAWQRGKSGDAGTTAESPELILLTPQRDLWLDRLADAGAHLPHDPIDATTNICEGEASAAVGWAVGAIASEINDGFHLPSDPISADPLLSRIWADARPGFSTLGTELLDSYSAEELPQPLTFRPARVVARVPALEFERSFSGELRLGFVDAPRELEPFPIDFKQRSTLVITLSEPIGEACLWLLANAIPGRSDLAVITVEDDRGNAWKFEDEQVLADGRIPLRFSPTELGNVRIIRVEWSVGVEISILGIGGISKTARDVATARNVAQAAETAQLGTPAAANPPAPGSPPNPAVRCLLAPGRLYRVDVDLHWSGTLYSQDDKGQKQLVDAVSDRDEYAPPTPASNQTLRRYYFRTVPVPEPPASVDLPWAITLLPGYGDPNRLNAVYRAQDVFDPQMLLRHLLGYEPAQSEVARFRNDPLHVHFGVAHAAGLADAYKYTLQLGIRRVDAPGAEGDLIELQSIWKALTEPSFLSDADQRRYEKYAASPCVLPKPGATLAAEASLAAEAWYEVFVQAKSQRPDTVKDGALPGVSFKTSRWLDAKDMLDSIGFPLAGGGRSAGDIEIKALPALSPAAAEGDAVYEAALESLGLDGWPLSSAPRTSIVWLKGETEMGPEWKCAGVMIEASEPIHRPKRAEIAGLALKMGNGDPGVTFDISRRDRLGARLLFLTSTPFTPIEVLPLHPFPGRGSIPLAEDLPHRLGREPMLLFIRPRLVLSLLDMSAVPGPNATLLGSLDLPLTPSFAGEV